MTQHRTARRRIVGAGLAALAAVGLLAGCSSRPGAAAIVDGQAIPSSDVATVVDELQPAVGQIGTSDVLNILIEEPTLVALASKHGDGVSDTDAKSTLDSLFTNAGIKPPASYSPVTLRVGLQQAAASKLSADANVQAIGQEFTTAMEKLDVSVNPRFGTWSDGEVGDPATPGWIVATGTGTGTGTGTATPAPTSSPAPTPSPTAGQ